MKLTVLNGSPKGNKSNTLKFVHHIGKEFPQHEQKIFNISTRIKRIKKNEQIFQEILESIRSSDGVLWASPVYGFLVPANLKRFIELIPGKGVEDVFQNKHTAFLTTSIHVFDHTAHNYIHAVCDDLDMRYVGSFSANYNDLEKPEEREKLCLFATNFFEEIGNNTLPPKNFMPLTWRDFDYAPGAVENKIDAGGKKVLILTDSRDNRANLAGMIERFRASFSTAVEVINLWDINIKGSCLGCLKCWNGPCVYEGKDGYLDFFDTKVRPADILVYAGTITDRYLSSRWKVYIDRSFCTGIEGPPMAGKQVGFIISGPLSQAANLRQILEAQVEIGQANLAGFVTDEYGDSTRIDNSLQYLAERLVRFAHNNFTQSATFFSVGVEKIFRDVFKEENGNSQETSA